MLHKENRKILYPMKISNNKYRLFAVGKSGAFPMKGKQYVFKTQYEAEFIAARLCGFGTIEIYKQYVARNYLTK